MNNYRTISKLTFLAKVLDKVVFNQLIGFLSKNSLSEKFQPGFSMAMP